ncbi:hypothetical protein V8B97DRAFT_2031957 [Scleroderma yunnanense]
MGPPLDATQTTHCCYHFPPYAPPSTPHTVNSSLQSDRHLHFADTFSSLQRPAFRRTMSQAIQCASENLSSSVSPPDSPRPRAVLPRSHRALTLPSQRDAISDHSFSKSRPLTRRFSSSSGSSSSVSDSPTIASQPLPSAGIGRKVAESLQLFKESAPSNTTDSWDIPDSDKVPSHRRHSTSHHPDNVAEAKFEFVKRADWPDPETAAIRRERSSTALERVRTLEATTQQHHAKEADVLSEQDLKSTNPSFNDPPQWRRDIASNQEPYIRGRRRERLPDVPVFSREVGTPEEPSNLVPPSPCIRPRSRGYPPSPSPSRCPTNCIPPLALYHISSDREAVPPLRQTSETHAPCSVDPESLESHIPEHTLSSYTSPAISPPPPLVSSAHRPYSPWSTDDESAWETSSITSDASTTSGTSEQPVSPVAFPSLSLDGDHDVKQSLSQSKDEEFPDDPATWNEDHLNMTFSDSQESLPHIPLRPFRNQVGGHSAIYKFTKRALCKPLVSRENQFYEAVEREAPPLLGFIPRYLGVMLVTYRRVPKGSTPPALSTTPTTHFPISCCPHRALESTMREPPVGRSSTRSCIPPSLPEEDTGGDTDIGEAEMPEVVLDRNRHIVPKWVLRMNSLRSRTYSQPYSSSPSLVSRDRLNPSHFSAIASSPALTLDERSSALKRSRPARQATVPATTAASSYFLSNTSPASGLDTRLAPRDLRQFHSESNISQQSSSSWFGGTGSTTVNTKLKDHVFNSILRRFQRRGNRCWSSSGTRTEDENEPTGPVRCTATGLSCRSSPVEQLKHEELACPTTIVRRVQSESAMDGKDGQDTSVDLDYNKLGGCNGRASRKKELQLGPCLSRRRSRSRSLDFSAQMHGTSPFSNRLLSCNRSDDSVTRQHHFILMEDLTGRLKHSCVLDLKMGTRQYGMDATSSKKKSQRKKCDRTTSRPLGVRVCGMQVWNHVTQSYVSQDKYKGRDIRAEDFPSVIASFLHDGQRLLVWQIPVLLQKLYALARIINRLKGFRFYGCSLLLIYDGDRDAQEAFRMSAQEHPSSRSKRGESMERASARSTNNSEGPSLRRTHSEDFLFGPVAKWSSSKRKRGEVNVRIVDFAHTTTGRDWAPHPPPAGRKVIHQMSGSKGYQAEVDEETGTFYARFPPHYPDEPDRGFLYGLKNLARALEKIWSDERMRRMKLSRDDPGVNALQLPPLPTEGKEVFEEIFGGISSDEDPGMLST